MSNKDWPINPTSVGTPPGDNGNNGKKELPKYDDDYFCNLIIKILNRFIGKGAGIMIEKIEAGTKREDYIEKADLWIKLININDPIGIQFTASGDQEKVEKKRKELKKNGNIATKESREDAIIKFSGKANVILIQENKERLLNYIKIGEKKGIDPAEVPGEEYVRDFIAKMLTEFGEVNFAFKKIFTDLIIEAGKHSKTKK